MKLVHKLLALLLVAGILAGAGYWYWTTTPQYALKELSSAIKEHDLATFEKYCDTQAVAANAVEDLLAEPVRNSGGLGILERLLGVLAVSWLKPQIVGSLKGGIERFVAPPPPEEERKGGLLSQVVKALKVPSLRESLNAMGFSRETYRGVSSVRQDKNAAYFDLKFETQPGKLIDVEVEMLNHSSSPFAGAWRVRRFSNLQTVAKSL